MGIFLYAISYSVLPFLPEVQDLMKNREYEIESGHSNYDRYTLTTTGEVIRLSEYCCRLANNQNVHVILL